MRNPVVERWKSLTREQKFSVGILSVCGAFALGLSALSFTQRIQAPFLVEKSKALAFRQGLKPTEEELVAKQRRTDTDGDGLSDWDEVSTYQTNPNLKDTCGDGVVDSVRVATGKPVTCRKPGVTSEGEIDFSQVSASTSQFLGNGTQIVRPEALFAQMLAAGAAARSGSNVTSTKAPTESVIPRDPALIRLLLKGKVDPSALDALSDEELLTSFDQALKEQSSQPPAP